MGTNYYLEEVGQEPCACCGRPFEVDRIHIGKSSGGWTFALHVIPEKGLNSLEEWKDRWNLHTNVIKNEYEEIISPEEMMNIITKRSWNKKNLWDSQTYIRNHAVPGPNGLVRHEIGPFCVGHGEGTWDLIPGDFS